MALTLRQFAASDAEAWLEVHHAAVHGLAASDYPRAVIDAWAPPVGATMIEALRAGPAGTKIVADLDGRVAGIAELALGNGKLRACYVSPLYARRGIGTALMATLEARARTAALDALSVHSSITAEPFYRHLGYGVTGRGFHVLHTGERMASVFMRKSL